MTLPDKLKTEILDASVGGIEAFLTCVGCCVVALHPKGRHDKAMREYCLSSEFFEKFIDQWGRRWSRPLTSKTKRSSRSPQPHRPTPEAITPIKSQHKNNDSSSSIRFLPSPQSPQQQDMVSGASTPGPSANENSVFDNQLQNTTFPAPFPASTSSAEHLSIGAFGQPNTEYEWTSQLDSLFNPPQEPNNGFSQPGFDCLGAYFDISTPMGPEDTSNEAIYVPSFEGDNMPRAVPETIGQNIIRPFSNMRAGAEQRERKQVGLSSRALAKGETQNQDLHQSDLHQTEPRVDEVPAIKVVTPNG